MQKLVSIMECTWNPVPWTVVGVVTAASGTVADAVLLAATTAPDATTMVTTSAAIRTLDMRAS
jgi:hypothetical protein